MHNNVAPSITIAIIAATLSSLSFADRAVLTAAPGRNAYLSVNERLISPSGDLALILQSDGNLVMYKASCVGTPSCAIWNSQSSQPVGSFFLAMQEDGNLVIYRGTPSNNQGVIWNSQSPGTFGNYFLALQDDQNLVIYRGTGPRDNGGAVWSTKTGLLNTATKNPQGRIELASAQLSPCSTLEWRQVYNATLKTAPQLWHAYAYVDQAALDSARGDIEQCLKDAIVACGVAGGIFSPAACAPAFTAKVTDCLQSHHLDQTLAKSIDLRSESVCDWH